MTKFKPNRVVVWFSAGVTSFIAAVMTVLKYSDKLPVVICYCDTGGEHPDNVRFIADCSKAIGYPITILKSEKYKDIWDVFEKTRYLAGVAGARCTTEMKKVLRNNFQDVAGDIQVFGFDSSETKRAAEFRANNPDVHLETPLLDDGLTKGDCLAILREMGIKMPAMYELGYRNNNCIGCVKGKKGYWNKIRRDFPDVFERMSKLEQKLGVAINNDETRENGKRIRHKLYLKDLPPEAGNYEAEPEVECGVLCQAVIEDCEL